VKKPNVIYILVDDLGWAEPGCYGNEFNETPNIDSLAKSGMLFTNAYASSTVCSPSRAGLLTGQSPPRNGITDYLRPWSDWHLPLKTGPNDFVDNELPEDTDYKMNEKFVSMAEMFKKSGYSTGIIGKWHLSGYDKNGVKNGPSKYGFDEVLISEQTGIGSGSYFHPYTKVDADIEPILGEDEYLVDRMNHEAVEFVKRHKDKPFFLYLSHYAVHTTLDAKEEDVQYFSEKRKSLEKKMAGRKEKKTKTAGNFLTKILTIFERLKPKNLLHYTKNKKRWITENNPVLAAMLKSVDDGVGEIQKTLKEFDLDQNTIIVFTSDNGGEARVTTNGPLRAGKSYTYEGGLRVSQIISFPGVVNSGAVSDFPTINLDFYPTFADLLGYEIPEGHILDGISILPLLKGEFDAESFSNRVLSWHYPLKIPHFLGGRSSAANRKGAYKSIWFFDKGVNELYDLKEDPSESIDLAEKYPERASKHRRLLKNWIKDVNGDIPKGQKEP